MPRNNFKAKASSFLYAAAYYGLHSGEMKPPNSGWLRLPPRSRSLPCVDSKIEGAPIKFYFGRMSARKYLGTFLRKHERQPVRN